MTSSKSLGIEPNSLLIDAKVLCTKPSGGIFFRVSHHSEGREEAVSNTICIFFSRHCCERLLNLDNIFRSVDMSFMNQRVSSIFINGIGCAWWQEIEFSLTERKLLAAEGSICLTEFNEFVTVCLLRYYFVK